MRHLSSLPAPSPFTCRAALSAIALATAEGSRRRVCRSKLPVPVPNSAWCLIASSRARSCLKIYFCCSAPPGIVATKAADVCRIPKSGETIQCSVTRASVPECASPLALFTASTESASKRNLGSFSSRQPHAYLENFLFIPRPLNRTLPPRFFIPLIAFRAETFIVRSIHAEK